MNFYPLHIGDYAGHTRHLSLLEDLAYRRLLDAYYLNERPLNGSPRDVARLIGMHDHVDAVEYVLGQFFKTTEDGYRNARADIEIEKFHAKRQQQSLAGKSSAQRRINRRLMDVQRMRDDEPTDVQPTINQEPLTNNQEPNKSNSYTSVPDVVDASGDRRPACPHREIIAAYHELLPACPRVLPELWSGAREVALRTRWNEKPERQNLDWWRDFFRYIGYSSFLTGRAPTSGDRKPFVATLDWIVKPSNFVKIYEGRYLNPNEAAAYERDHGDDNES